MTLEGLRGSLHLPPAKGARPAPPLPTTCEDGGQKELRRSSSSPRPSRGDHTGERPSLLSTALSCSPARTKSLSLSRGGRPGPGGAPGLPGADPPLWPHRFPLFPPAPARCFGQRRRPFPHPVLQYPGAPGFPRCSTRHARSPARSTSPRCAPTPAGTGQRSAGLEPGCWDPTRPPVPKSGSHVARGSVTWLVAPLVPHLASMVRAAWGGGGRGMRVPGPRAPSAPASRSSQ